MVPEQAKALKAITEIIFLCSQRATGANRGRKKKNVLCLFEWRNIIIFLIIFCLPLEMSTKNFKGRLSETGSRFITKAPWFNKIFYVKLPDYRRFALKSQLANFSLTKSSHYFRHFSQKHSRRHLFSTRPLFQLLFLLLRSASAPRRLRES